MRRDIRREARERLRGEFRGERLAMGLLAGREAERADRLQVRVSGVGERGRKRRASGEKHPINCAPTADNSPANRMMFFSGALQRGLVHGVKKVDIRSGSMRYLRGSLRRRRGDLIFHAEKSTSPQRRKRFMLNHGVGAASQNAWNIAKSSGCRFLA